MVKDHLPFLEEDLPKKLLPLRVQGCCRVSRQLFLLYHFPAGITIFRIEKKKNIPLISQICFISSVFFNPIKDTKAS